MNVKHASLWMAAAALLLCCGCARGGAAAPGTIASKGEVSLEQAVIDTLCTPEMRGRRVGSAENLAAGEYIASVFADLKLTPLLGGSFAVPYEQDIINAEQAEPRLTAQFADGSKRALVFGSEFSFSLAEGAVDCTLRVTDDPRDEALAESIYIGAAIDQTQAVWPAYLVDRVKAGSVAMFNTSQKAHPRISIEQGVMEELTRAGLDVFSLSCRDVRELSAQNNYIGVIKGKDSTRAAIIGAHFDAAGANGDVYSAGAVDNASGVAVVLGMAQRLCEGETPAIDLVICALNGEEDGMRGSAAVAREITAQYEASYYVNVDCVGLRQGGAYRCVTGEQTPLVQAFSAALTSAGYALLPDAAAAGDWTSFDGVPIPAVTLDQPSFLSIYHTKDDRPAALDVAELEKLSAFLADFVRDGGDNVYETSAHAEEENDPERAAADKARAQRAQLVEELGLAFDERYQYVLDGYFISLSGNRPVHTADELRAMYPWVEARDELGTFTLREVMGIDGQTNAPLSVSDVQTSVGPARDGTQYSPLPLNEVVRLAPGALDTCDFVYEDKTGRLVRLFVARSNAERWARLSAGCVPLTREDGAAVEQVYYTPREGTAEMYSMYYYTGGEFHVQIVEFDLSCPMGEENGGVTRYGSKALSPQQAAELIEQLALADKGDYFSALLRDPDQN